MYTKKIALITVFALTALFANYSMAYELFVKKIGETIKVEIEETDTILEVKRKIEVKTNIPVGQQRLIAGGKIFQNNQTAKELDLNKIEGIDLVVKEEPVLDSH